MANKEATRSDKVLAHNGLGNYGENYLCASFLYHAILQMRLLESFVLLVKTTEDIDQLLAIIL